MKSFLSAALIVVAISFSNAQEKSKTYLMTNSIKGNAKSITRSYYNVVGTKKELDYTDYLILDKTGNLISESSKSAQETTPDKTVYTYDNRNNQISSTEYIQDTVINTIQEMKYNEKNILIESSVKSSSYNSQSFFTYQFDNKGNISEKKEKSVEVDFEITTKTAYVYDDKRNLLEENYYDSGNNLKFSHQFKYNDKGKVIESTTIEADGSVSKKSTYQYDDKGNGIQVINYSKSGIILETINYIYESYDAKGNWTVLRKITNGIEDSRIEREILFY